MMLRPTHTLARTVAQLRSSSSSSIPAVRAAVAATVLRRSEHGVWHVLLVKRSKEPAKGLWSLPGGSIEVGETMRSAVQREVREECGLDVHVPELPVFTATDAIHHDAAGGVPFHFVIAHAVAFAAPHAVPTAGDDAADARWLSVGPPLKQLVRAGGAPPLTAAVVVRAKQLVDTGVIVPPVWWSDSGAGVGESVAARAGG